MSAENLKAADDKQQPSLATEAVSGIQMETFYYDNKIVKYFAYACLFWGLVGMLAGLWAALSIA